MPRGADRPALGLRGGGHPRVGGDPVPPHFSRIAASAAALSGKPVVSAETFTCLYGFVTPTTSSPTATGTRSRWPT